MPPFDVKKTYKATFEFFIYVLKIHSQSVDDGTRIKFTQIQQYFTREALSLAFM